MRKYFLYLLAALVLTSCDNLKKKGSTSEDDTEESTTKKKKKPLDEEENTDEEETPKKKKKTTDYEATDDETNNRRDDVKPVDEDANDNYNNAGWSSSDKRKFIDECVGTAEKNIGEQRAKQYCSCFLEKLQTKYNSYTDANNMTQTELNKWAGECNRQ